MISFHVINIWIVVIMAGRVLFCLFSWLKACSSSARYPIKWDGNWMALPNIRSVEKSNFYLFSTSCVRGKANKCDCNETSAFSLPSNGFEEFESMRTYLKKERNSLSATADWCQSEFVCACNLLNETMIYWTSSRIRLPFIFQVERSGWRK